jgi:type I restriction enzyme M protein
MKTSQWIKDRRAAAGLSQAQLAEKTGVTQPIVSQWERGIAEPSPIALGKLRALFGEPGSPAPLAPAAEPAPTPPPEEPAGRAGRKQGARGERRAAKATGNGSGANLGFEDKLWAAADKLRGHMDASEYKHVVLGLIFLKYISDAFEERRQAILLEPGANPEDRDEYIGERIFWVPEEARWSRIQEEAPQATIGKVIDDAMTAIERENSSLKGVLPKDYNRPQLDKARLGGIVNLVSGIGLGDAASRSKDVLGRVYEYFLGRFAAAEGKSGGEFYTPQCVVKLLVEMIEPLKGRVYDPCCGSGGMFVSSERFVVAHGGRRADLSIFGQESNYTTWRLAKMNLAIRGIDTNLGPEPADSFHRDLHPDLKADYVLANPPFNDSDWGGERLREDKRWKYGTPPVGNANYAWIQHFIHHLAPGGIAGFVMANGSLSSNQSGEGEIRKNLVEADLVDCVIALPPQLFYTTPISVCLWFLVRRKEGHGLRDRRRECLFIDARKQGHLTDRTHRDLSEDEILRIAHTYHAWRGGENVARYRDIRGFCKAATIDTVRQHLYTLTPGAYVGTEEIQSDAAMLQKTMESLTEEAHQHFSRSAALEKRIIDNLKELGLWKPIHP